MNPIPESELSAIEARCNAAKLIEWLKSQCNRHANGQCMTVACLRRGGIKFGATPDYASATCEHHELITAVTDLPKLLAAYREARSIIDDLRQYVAHRPVCRVPLACDCGFLDAIARADAAMAGKEKA